MTRHLTSVAAALLLATALAACGSSAPVASPDASAAPQGSAAPSAAPSASDVAVSAAPSASDVTASPPPSPVSSASAAPARTPTPNETALMAYLPKKVGDAEYTPFAINGNEYLAFFKDGNPVFVKFLANIGVKPETIIIAMDKPTAGSTRPISIDAYRFTGADPATLKREFLSENIAADPGSKVTDATVGGKAVTEIASGTDAKQPPLYLYFKGDIVFVVSASDPAAVGLVLAQFP